MSEGFHPSSVRKSEPRFVSILKFEPEESKVEGRKWFFGNRFIPS